ncbi:MAG: zinc-ribbon domain-containing protein [Syntrophomonadaceae bacterium]
MSCFGMIGNVGPFELIFLLGFVVVVAVVVIVIAVSKSTNKPPTMNQGDIPISGPGTGAGFCRQCGSRVETGSLYCSKCGTPVQ